ACQYSCRFFANSIPHIRAIGVNPDEPLAMTRELIEYGIREVLVIGGDAPRDFSRPVYPSTTISVIRKLKQELPHLKVYAGTDPYRDSIRRELLYNKMKLDAGADGFFTQPFYDIRLMEIYAELLADVPVFWGVSPVLSPESRLYWETKNSVIFPKDFSPTLEWNRSFASLVLEFIDTRGHHAYFMPIRENIRKYLTGIL
ncbi:methylenetetrahydrofolate reductase, partial [bacterium]|nr:methylenetetrahydrofolate reductase [candidate division CSSED10-310 bacterium]